jgi:alkylation response protein AidB-like acyl-CoA dehydrogenase
MRFSFTEDQLSFGAAVRDMLSQECTPAVVRAAWADGEARPGALWEKLAQMGVLGMTAAERWGGLAMDELDCVLVFEESGRAALPGPLVETTAVAIPLLEALGSDAVKDRWVGGAAAGKAMLAVGLEDARFVVDADLADLLVLQQADELHAVAAAHVTLTAQRSVDHARRLFSVTWTPTEATRLAAGAAARREIVRARQRGALAASAQLLGLARRLLDITVEYVKVRTQFSRPIGSFQAVKHKLTDALVALEFARPVVYRAAYSMARGDAEAPIHASMAKVYASQAATLTARHALQCHGAIGYSFEHDLHLWMKRVWALAAAWGDVAWHRRQVGAALLGEP